MIDDDTILDQGNTLQDTEDDSSVDVRAEIQKELAFDDRTAPMNAGPDTIVEGGDATHALSPQEREEFHARLKEERGAVVRNFKVGSDAQIQNPDARVDSKLAHKLGAARDPKPIHESASYVVAKSEPPPEPPPTPLPPQEATQPVVIEDDGELLVPPKSPLPLLVVGGIVLGIGAALLYVVLS